MSNERRAQQLRLFLIAGVVSPVVMAGAGMGLAWLLGHRPPDLARPVGAVTVAAALVAAAASMGLVSLLYRLHPALERALRHSGVRVGMDALEVAGYPLMLVVVTAAAFGEEMLFRGGLQPVIGLVPAALLFGFSHGGWRREMWAYALAAALSGTILGTLYWLTGNIWAPVIAHAAHNVLSTILMGKKFAVTWQGWLPRIRLVPDPRDLEFAYPEGLEPAEVAADDASVDVAVPAPTDSPEPGADDGDSADGQPE